MLTRDFFLRLFDMSFLWYSFLTPFWHRSQDLWRLLRPRKDSPHRSQVLRGFLSLNTMVWGRAFRSLMVPPLTCSCPPTANTFCIRHHEHMVTLSGYTLPRSTLPHFGHRISFLAMNDGTRFFILFLLIHSLNPFEKRVHGATSRGKRLEKM